MKTIVEFELGDVVFLNSDVCFDTPMTVEGVSVCECGIDNIDVVWISDYTGEVLRDSFPASCVMCID